jgi:hypothetical protein
MRHGIHGNAPQAQLSVAPAAAARTEPRSPEAPISGYAIPPQAEKGRLKNPQRLSNALAQGGCRLGAVGGTGCTCGSRAFGQQGVEKARQHIVVALPKRAQVRPPQTPWPCPHRSHSHFHTLLQRCTGLAAEAVGAAAPARPASGAVALAAPPELAVSVELEVDVEERFEELVAVAAAMDARDCERGGGSIFSSGESTATSSAPPLPADVGVPGTRFVRAPVVAAPRILMERPLQPSAGPSWARPLGATARSTNIRASAGVGVGAPELCLLRL